MTRWQLQDAKARLSELVRKAQTEGPQEITVHGKSEVVVLSRSEFDKIKSRKVKRPSFVEFMRSSPLVGVDLNLERSRESTDRPLYFLEDIE